MLFAYAKTKAQITAHSNCADDQCLCFLYIDSTIILLSKSKISSLQPSSVVVQPGLCWTWSETPRQVFLRHTPQSRVCSSTRENLSLRFSNQAWCAATEAGYRREILDIETRSNILTR